MFEYIFKYKLIFHSTLPLSPGLISALSTIDLALFVPCTSYTFLISNFYNFLATPDAVSSSEDPLVGDQGATTGVVEVAATLVLQRHLKRTNKDST